MVLFCSRLIGAGHAVNDRPAKRRKAQERASWSRWKCHSSRARQLAWGSVKDREPRAGVGDVRDGQVVPVPGPRRA